LVFLTATPNFSRGLTPYATAALTDQGGAT